MTYHEYGGYTSKWSSLKKSEAEEMKKQTKNPRIQVISPQKKLYDIQQILNELSEKAMSVVELSDTIQSILDGEI